MAARRAKFLHLTGDHVYNPLTDINRPVAGAFQVVGDPHQIIGLIRIGIVVNHRRHNVLKYQIKKMIDGIVFIRNGFGRFGILLYKGIQGLMKHRLGFLSHLRNIVERYDQGRFA